MLVPTLSRRLRTRPISFERWRDRPATATDEQFADRPWDEYGETVPATEIQGQGAAGFGRVREAILRLDLFPPRMLRLFPDAADGRATEGVVALERIYFGPIGFDTACRLRSVVDDGPVGPRVAVDWVTLPDHPERGFETFAAELLDDGSIRVVLRSKSRPAMLVVRLGTPLARVIQRHYSNASVRHLAAIARGVNPAT